jgi:Ulp1 family protease
MYNLVNLHKKRELKAKTKEFESICESLSIKEKQKSLNQDLAPAVIELMENPYHKVEPVKRSELEINNPISDKDLACLSPDNYLNDTIINNYIE